MLPPIAKDFLNSLSLKSSTIKRYNADLLLFYSWIDKSLHKDPSHDSEAMQRLITAFIHHLQIQNYSQATIKRLCSVLNQFTLYCGMSVMPSIQKTVTAYSAALKASDFITAAEWDQLVQGISKASSGSPREILKRRNTAIIFLLRQYGLSVSEVYNLNMSHINFAQNELTIVSDKVKRQISLEHPDKLLILQYLNEIPPLLRPRLKTEDPLFVAFFNKTMSYRYNYAIAQPKRLSIRAIQKMIKDEVKLAGLRPFSATHLRNTSILDQLTSQMNENEIMSYFGLTSSQSLKRYTDYINKE